MKKVTVGLVLFGTKYLKESLPSLLNQDYPNVEFIFRDQEEGIYSAYSYIQENMPEVFDNAMVHRDNNLFHSGGHNKNINEMNGEIYFCCSNDMLYPKNFVSKMVESMEKYPDHGVATCKILRWDYENQVQTNIIDSCGIGIKPYHHFYDIGQGQEDNGQYDDKHEVFGASGALAVYTKLALKTVKFQGEYFDSLLHYKNDVDLSYRLRWAGQKTLLVSDVVVYHDRQLGKQSTKSKFMMQSSFLGEKVLMRKNYSKKFPLWVRFQTFFYHFLKTTYLLMVYPGLLSEYSKIRKKNNEIERKRAHISKAHPENIFPTSS